MSVPVWVYDLITAVEIYENIHGPHDEHWPCLGKVLDAVPERERDCARAIVTWRQESGWLPPDAQRSELSCSPACSEAHAGQPH